MTCQARLVGNEYLLKGQIFVIMWFFFINELICVGLFRGGEFRKLVDRRRSAR